VQVLVVIAKFDRKSNKSQKRGKINLIGRLQLSTERSREEDNEGIVQLRILRVQVS
jgi:cullin 5